MLKKVLMGLGGLGVVGAIALAGGAFFLSSQADARMTQTFAPHEVDFPIPTPLTDDEVSALRAEKLEALKAVEGQALDDDGNPVDADGAIIDPMADVDLAAVAKERALERGTHLVTALFACVECHGRDFGGGTMVDDPAIGTLLGPNITIGGKGSRTEGYTTTDWDRIVRHGVKPDGTPAVMPSEDFLLMSDQELSDVIVYIQSMPPVDKTVPAPFWGPIGTMLVATGKMPISAENHHDHQAAHQLLPPEAAETVEFGEHLAGVCTGCHRTDLSGGPMPFGPPDWPPAANLTAHEEGLAGWTYEQFDAAFVKGKRPNGEPMRVPMSLMMQYSPNWTETEKKALFKYLQSVEAKPTGL